MSSKEGFTEGGGGGIPVNSSAFVDGGEIKVAKLVGTLLSALWLVIVSGWITVANAIVTAHIRIIGAVEDLYVNLITSIGVGTAETFRLGWRSAAEGALTVSPLLAPAIFSLEIVFVATIFLSVRRRAFNV